MGVRADRGGGGLGERWRPWAGGYWGYARGLESCPARRGEGRPVFPEGYWGQSRTFFMTQLRLFLPSTRTHTLLDAGISVAIMFNSALKDIKALSGLSAINGDLVLSGNRALSTLQPLSQVGGGGGRGGALRLVFSEQAPRIPHRAGVS